MLTRRVFGKWMAAGLGASALAPEKLLMGQSPASVAAGFQFSVMMWALKSHGSFEENLERIAQAGYRHMELVGEFKKWSEADWQRILGRMKALGVTVDATTGVSMGFADPSGGDAFISELKELIPIAHRLQASQIILVSGIEGAAPGSQHQASIDTLKRSVELLSAAGLVAVIEPIDRLENPPIYLDGVTESFEIVRAVGSPHVKVLYDFYHEQRTHGNLIEKLEKNFDQVGLVHIADVPGRHEPGTGEVNYINIYRKLKQLKYKGVIAMEFYPTGDVVQALRHAREEAMQA